MRIELDLYGVGLDVLREPSISPLYLVHAHKCPLARTIGKIDL